MKNFLLLTCMMMSIVGISQNFSFELKDAYETNSLRESELDYTYHKNHSPISGNKFVVIIGTIKSTDGEDGKIDEEEVIMSIADKNYVMIGEMDFDWMLFSEGGTDIYFEEEMEWVSMVFMVPSSVSSGSLKLGEKNIEVTFAKEGKYKSPQCAGSITSLKIIDQLVEEDNYDWDDKEGTSYQLSHQPIVGKLLQVGVSLKITSYEAFHTIINYTNHGFTLLLPSKIMLHCLGAASDDSYISENYNYNIHTNNLRDGVFYIYFLAGEQSADFFKGSILYHNGQKVATL